MKKENNEELSKPNELLFDITYDISDYFYKNYPERLEKVEDILTKISSKPFWSNEKKINFLKDKFSYVFEKKDKTVQLSENDLIRIIKRVINEQNEEKNINKAVQCFLNKKGIKDNAGNSLIIDGIITPNSKSAEAIIKFQKTIKAKPDGVWGDETYKKMTESDKNIFKDCRSKYGDIIDKGIHFFGLD